jgi:hypothetical protein
MLVIGKAHFNKTGKGSLGAMVEARYDTEQSSGGNLLMNHYSVIEQESGQV